MEFFLFKFFVQSSISYFGTAKNRFQLEIPEAKCKNLSDDYELTSSKKGFKRYEKRNIF